VTQQQVEFQIIRTMIYWKQPYYLHHSYLVNASDTLFTFRFEIAEGDTLSMVGGHRTTG